MLRFLIVPQPVRAILASSGLGRWLGVTAIAFVLVSCSSRPGGDLLPSVKGFTGAFHGGQQAIAGATVQLYAVGSTGDGLPATPLLTRTVLTDSNGYFNITGLYTCPSASSLVYLTGTGGSPGSGVRNPQIALMAAIGACGTLTPSSFININELTTVAAVYMLAPFMSSYSAIGSGAADADALATAFTQAGYFVDLSTGIAPGPSLPPGYTVPIAQMNTIADIVGACINSAGGISGDSTVCGRFFALTRPFGGTVSTNTIAALLNLARNPTLNISPLYDLVPADAPYQPTQPMVPADLALRLVAPSGFVVSPSAVTFPPFAFGASASATTLAVSVTNGTSSTINLSNVHISGADASDFSIQSIGSSDCNTGVPLTPVAANTTCTIHVVFQPTATGTRSAFLVIPNSSANPSITVGLLGSASTGTTGPLVLSTTGLYFDTNYDPQTVTLTNSGTTAVNFGGSSSTTGFNPENLCGSSLAPGASCRVIVHPQINNTPPTGTLTIGDDASNAPQVVSLQFGTGYGSPSASVDFGHVAIGVTPGVSMYESGPGRYGGFSFTITGPNAGDFSFSLDSPTNTAGCSYDYQRGQYCELTFYFTPKALISSTAYINGGTITGVGDPPGVDFDLYTSVLSQPGGSVHVFYNQHVTSLDLGGMAPGVSTQAQFKPASTGTIPVTLNPPVLSGTNASEFAISSGCSIDTMCTVTFTPTDAGPRGATATFRDATNTITRTLMLRGLGTRPAPVITTSDSLSFGNTAFGTVSAPQTITITAYHNDPIQAALAVVPNSSTSQSFVFVGPSSCPSTPCTLQVAYAPKTGDFGSTTVVLTVTDPVGFASSSVNLKGQAYSYTFSPGSLVFAPQSHTAVSAPQAVTFTNTGTTEVPLTFSLINANGAPVASFLIGNNCPALLPVRGACTINVSFAPALGPGPYSAYLNVGPVFGFINLSGYAN